MRRQDRETAIIKLKKV